MAKQPEVAFRKSDDGKLREGRSLESRRSSEGDEKSKERN